MLDSKLYSTLNYNYTILWLTILHYTRLHYTALYYNQLSILVAPPGGSGPARQSSGQS